MRSKYPYSTHLDTLIALVTYLAMTHRKQLRPSRLAKRLALDLDNVKEVLQTFKGLFREGRPTKRNPDEQRYTLHLRYALRDRAQTEDDAEEDDGETQPLDPMHLTALLEFISERARQEGELRKQRIGSRVTMIAAIVAACASIVSVLLKSS